MIFNQTFVMKKITFFTLLAVAMSCLFISCDDEQPEPVPPTETVLYFFKGQLGGEAVDLSLTLSNDITNYHTHGGSLGESCVFDYGASIGDQFDNPPLFDFELKSMYSGECGEENDVFNGLITPDSFSYYEDGMPNSVSVTVGMMTANGYFSSQYGTQTGASFEITSSTETNNTFGKFQLLEGTVNCTLYNEDDNSQTLELENGTFKLDVASYFN